MATRHQYLIIHASEPRRNSNKPLQHIEKLSIARFQQAHSQVRMQWKRRASEPYRKAESGSQPTRNKCVARSSTNSQQMRCKIFNNYTHGSDPWRVWNTTDCKYTLEVLLAGVATKHATEQPRHLNRDKTQEIHRNTLRNFPLHGLSKHLSWFRCSGKEMHLNRSKTRKIPNVL